MPRFAHRTGALLVALALPAALPLALPQAAHAAPPSGPFGAAIEDLADYDGQDTCSPSAKAGTLALRSLLMTVYRGTGDLGISRDCAIGGASEHKEGRAWDWAVNAYDDTQDEQARDMLAWLMATDSHGNQYAMARRLGIMYVIYNRHIWSSSQASSGWRPYTGASPHTDHVHISLSRLGGDKKTSYWGAVPVTTTPTSSPVVAKWKALGGADGELGEPVRGEYAVKGGRAQDYQRGRIYWSATTGAAAVWGAIAARYDALGGPAGDLGLPTADEGDVFGVPGARASIFQGGRIYWSAGTGVGSVQGAIAARHSQLGGGAGQLGLPVDDESATGSGRQSTFQRGRVVWSGATGARVVAGAIAVGWDRLGAGGGALGLPTSDELSAPGGGRLTTFQNGRVYWSAGTGVAAVLGAIAQRYDALGGPAGPLGLPVADEAAAGKGRVSRFVGGRLVWGPATGTYLVSGAIGVGWDRLGGAAGPLGLPRSDEQAVPGGRASAFQGGTVYWSPATGVAAVQGAIALRHEELGGAAALGLPLSDEQAVPGGRMSPLQRARIFWGPATGAHAVSGAIGVGYDQAGGPAGPLGLPTSEEAPAGRDGRASSFAGGRVIWSPATGVQPVTGAALAQLDAQGGVSGWLGFPVSGQTRVTTSTAQQLFQGGRIYVTAARAQSLRGAILATYLHLGGPGGGLGAPVSDEYDVPGGKRTDFERGALVFDSSTGHVTRL